MGGLLQLQKFSPKSEGSEPHIRPQAEGSALGKGAQKTFVFEGQLGVGKSDFSLKGTHTKASCALRPRIGIVI